MKLQLMMTRLLLLLIALVCSNALASQDHGMGHGDTPALRELVSGTSAINVELSNPTGTISDFSQAVLIVAWLNEDTIPFNELTQGQWTHHFDYVIREMIDHKRVATETEMMIPDRDRKPIRARAYNLPTSGITTIRDLPELQRLALAVTYGGVFWPLKREIYFTEPESEAEAPITIFDTTTDTASLIGRSHDLEVRYNNNAQTPDLRWHSVEVHESIVIENTHETHAVAPRLGAALFRIPLTPPPSVDPIQLQGMMLTSWHYFVGERQMENNPFDPEDLDIAPYQPWSRNTNWGGQASGHGHGHGHGSPMERQYLTFGAKNSGDNSHPLNREGYYDFLGAGDVWLAMVDQGDGSESLMLHVGKPIPPGKQITLHLAQKPGIHVDTPQPIILERDHLPFDIDEVRVVGNPELYELKGGAGLAGLTLDNGRGKAGPITRNELFDFVIAPSATLLNLLSERSGIDRAKEAKAAARPASSLPDDDEGLRWDAIFWIASVVFGLGFLAALVGSIRGNTDKQTRAITGKQIPRQQIVDELKALDADLMAGKIPARVHADERRNIIDRAVLQELHKSSPDQKSS